MNNNHKYFKYFFFIKFIFLIHSINIAMPQLLNNIIQLGGEKFRYSHFSFNSNGDMIIDTSAFPVTNKRNFYGLQKNGRFYFNDINNNIFSMTVDHTKGKLEGESYFIKLTSSNSNFHGRELIIGISKNKDDDSQFYAEIYNLKNKNFTKYLTTSMFGNIIADTFTVIKHPDESDSKYYYTLAYIIKNGNQYKLNFKKTYFSFELTQGRTHDKDYEREVSLSRTVSSFYTKNLIFICFYINK